MTNQTKKTRVSRRTLLKGAAALGVAGALSPMHRIAAGQDGVPRRFVFFLSGNGFDAAGLFSDETRSFIESARGTPIDESYRWGESRNRGYEHSGAGPQILSDDLSSAPYLTGLGSLASKASVVLGLSSVVTGGYHGSFHGVLSSTRSLNRRPSGMTIDAHLALLDSVRGTGDRRTPVSAIRVAVSNDFGISYTNCASGPGQPLPTIGSAAGTWDAYVGPLVSADGIARVEQRTRMLEAAAQETELQLGAAVGHSRQQLSSHQSAIAELLGNQSRFGEVISAYGGEAAPPRPTDEGNVLDRMREHAANVAFALRHGVTNVAFLGMGTSESFHGLNYGFGALNGGNHGLRHDFASNADIRRDLREVWRQEVEAFLSIARTLDSVPEGSGTMLDHTVMAYLPDNGAEHHSSAREFPVLLLGGGAIGLRSEGRSLIYPDFYDGGAGHRQLSNLWNTIGGPLAGTTLDDFGGEGANRRAAGPLEELVLS